MALTYISIPTDQYTYANINSLNAYSVDPRPKFIDNSSWQFTKNVEFVGFGYQYTGGTTPPSQTPLYAIFLISSSVPNISSCWLQDGGPSGTDNTHVSTPSSYSNLTHVWHHLNSGSTTPMQLYSGGGTQEISTYEFVYDTEYGGGGGGGEDDNVWIQSGKDMSYGLTYSITVTENNQWIEEIIPVQANYVYDISATVQSEHNYDGIYLGSTSRSSGGRIDNMAAYTDCILALTSSSNGTSTTSSTTYTAPANGNIYLYFRTDSSGLYPSSGETGRLEISGHLNNNITITLNDNGGSGGSGTKTVTSGTVSGNMGSVNVPTRGSNPAFTFVGYYDTVAYSGGRHFIDSSGNGTNGYSITSAITLYARWSNTISYEPGSSFSLTYSTSQQSRTIASTATCASGGTVTYSISSVRKNGTIITNPGFAIALASNGATTNLIVPAGQAVGTYTITIGLSSPHSGNASSNTYAAGSLSKTVTITISQSNITITIGKNGGTGGVDSVSVSPGASSWSISTVPTRTGFSLLGFWDTSNFSGGTKYLNASGSSVRSAPTSSTTIYARWEPIVNYSTTSSSYTAYCTTSNHEASTTEGSQQITISSGGTTSSGLTITYSENNQDWTVSSDGKKITIPNGLSPGTYELEVSAVISGSDTTHNTTTFVDNQITVTIVAVTKYPNNSNPTKYKNTSGTAGTNVTYGTPTISIGSGLSAGGGSATVSCSVPNTTTTWYWKYTNGTYSSQQSSSAAGSVSWSITTQTFTPSGGSASTITRFSKSSNTLSHTTMGTNVGTDYVKVTAVNDGDSSKTATDTESISNTSSTSTSITAYGTPTVSIGSGLTAAGGSAVITCSVSNTQTTTTSYTSGSSTSSDSTVAGTAVWRITSNGNSRFSHPTTGGTNISGIGTVYSSGNSVSHSNMGANEVTDTVTVTAYNYGSTSKTATDSYSITNPKSWHNPSFSTPTNNSHVSLAVAGQTYSISPAATQQQIYASGTVAQTVTLSSSDFTYTVATSKDGFSLSSGAVTVTNNTSTSARNGFKVKITATKNSKSATRYQYYDQAAGSQAYMDPVITGFTYETFAAGGATKTPTITYYQDYAWNGVAGSGTRTENTGGTLAYTTTGSLPSGFSTGSNYSTTGSVTWANRTNVEGDARDAKSNLKLTITMNSKTSSAFTCTSCVQAANVLTWNNPTVTYSGSTQFANTGGTITMSKSNISISQSGSYTSGSTASNTTLAGLNFAETTSKTGFTYSKSGSGVNTTASNVADNNASISAVTGNTITITATGSGSKTGTKAVTFTQVAGTKVYSNPSIIAYTYSTTANTGETDVVPAVSYTQGWTWNGVFGSGGTITSGGILAFTCASGTPDRFSTGTNFTTTGKITWGNNNTASAKDAKSKLSVTVTLNSKTSSAYTCTACSQSAGAKSYSTPTVNTFSYATFAAAGATKSPSVTYSMPYTWNGVSADSGTDTSGGTLTYSKGTLTSGATADSSYSSNGKITWANNTTTSSRSTHSVLTVTVKTPTGNQTSSAKTCTACTQSAGAKVYETPTLSGNYTYATAAAAGVTDASPNALPSYSQVWTWNGVSGSGGTLTSGQTVTYNYTAGTLPTGFTKGTNFATTGKINWSNNNSTSTRTATSILSVTLTINGKTSASKACTACTQSAGAKVYGTPTVSTYTYSTSVSAAGTTDLAPASLTYSQTWTWNGVSGSGGTISTGGTLAFTRATTYSWMTAGTNFATTGKITVASLGTTISNARNFYSALSVTVTLNGKTSSSKTATAGGQVGNYVTAIATGDSSGGTGNHFSYANITAGATSASPSLTGGATYTFTSGSTKFESSGSPSFGGTATYTRSYSLGTVQNGFTAVNATSGVLTATSRGTTPGDARTSGTVTGTLVVKYTHASSYSAGGTVTAPTYTSTATCTQAANALTGLAISVGTNPINYGGTSTCTVTATYTSGATKNVDCDTNTTYSFNPTGIVTVTKS